MAPAPVPPLGPATLPELLPADPGPDADLAAALSLAVRHLRPAPADVGDDPSERRSLRDPLLLAAVLGLALGFTLVFEAARGGGRRLGGRAARSELRAVRLALRHQDLYRYRSGDATVERSVSRRYSFGSGLLGASLGLRGTQYERVAGWRWVEGAGGRRVRQTASPCWRDGGPDTLYGSLTDRAGVDLRLAGAHDLRVVLGRRESTASWTVRGTRYVLVYATASHLPLRASWRTSGLVTSAGRTPAGHGSAAFAYPHRLRLATPAPRCPVHADWDGFVVVAPSAPGDGGLFGDRA